jgi:hypothetical protein
MNGKVDHSFNGILGCLIIFLPKQRYQFFLYFGNMGSELQKYPFTVDYVAYKSIAG